MCITTQQMNESIADGNNICCVLSYKSVQRFGLHSVQFISHFQYSIFQVFADFIETVGKHEH